MKFRTEYDPSPSALRLDPEKSVVLLGSCFTDNIGARMRTCRWRAFPNPCGTLFNPRSISNLISLAAWLDNPEESVDFSLAERDGLWVSWLMDSGAATFSREETRRNLLGRLRLLCEKLAESDALIVTFGTAWVYELAVRPGYVVSNCHKFPASRFVRRRLTVNEIIDDWAFLLSCLLNVNPDLKVILTVSPVRHLKDGFEGNSRSKAVLQLACEALSESYASTGRVSYFPAFEIMNDDLRDYRFYASDLVHPSEEGVDYIWDLFQQTYLSEDSRALLREGEKVTRRLSHRPILRGENDLARQFAARQREEALEQYRRFLAAHPTMLTEEPTKSYQ